MTDAKLALIISVGSAGLALVSFVWTIGWSVWQHRRLNHPRLTVLATNALPVGPGGAGEWCISVTVVNDGAVAVTVTTLKFVVRGDASRRGLFPPWVNEEPQPLPVKLAPGDRWTGLADLKSLVSTLVENFGQRSTFNLLVVGIDAANREYRGKFSVSGAFAISRRD
jgi:hypothetical protein